VPHNKEGPPRKSQRFQATVEKILKCLGEDKKDVRKGDWTNKEVRLDFPSPSPTFLVLDDKEHVARIKPSSSRRE